MWVVPYLPWQVKKSTYLACFIIGFFYWANGKPNFAEQLLFSERNHFPKKAQSHNKWGGFALSVNCGMQNHIDIFCVFEKKQHIYIP